jgi:hypothetical protein
METKEIIQRINELKSFPYTCLSLKNRRERERERERERDAVCI